MITYSENNWLHDVQDCVNELSSNDFTLDDVYQFESRLAIHFIISSLPNI